MRTVISIYTKNFFQEYTLPPYNNADYSLLISKSEFSLKEDIQFELEVIQDVWKVKEGAKYSIQGGNIEYTNDLKDLGIFQINTNNNEMITIIPKMYDSAFRPLKKYKMLYDIAIGKDEANEICYNFDFISKKHAIITYRSNGYYLVDYSTNGTYVNNKKVNNVRLQFGDFINIFGLHIIFLEDSIAIDTQPNIKIKEEAFIEIADEQLSKKDSEIKKSSGKTIFRRAPRSYQEILEETIDIEEPPELSTRKKQPLLLMIGPSITMSIPMLLGCFMMIIASNVSGSGTSLFMYSGLIMATSSAIIAVIWTFVNMKYQDEEELVNEELRRTTYSNYIIEKTEEIKRKHALAERNLLNTYPSVNKVITYSETSGSLWNRNQTHKDFLTHRLGVGSLDFNLNIDVPKKKFKMIRDELAEKPRLIKEKYGKLYKVPMVTNLLEYPIIGIVGQTKRNALDIVRLLTAQIVANNCYTDVKLSFIYDSSTSNNFEEWDFAKWLPHVWSEDKKIRYVASDKQEISDVLYEITNVLRNRIDQDSYGNKRAIPKPYYVVFVSDMKLLEGELFSKYVVTQNPDIGLTTIVLAEEIQELPNECEFIIENTNHFRGTYSVHNQQSTKRPIEFDYVEEKSLENFARYISTLQVNEIEEGGGIPDSLTFFDMYGVDRLEQLPIHNYWVKNRTYENIRGFLGARAGGNICYLDVHEKYHGPHGLVAGTTGSGKSETLQTYMLSLAVNYSPDDVSFFIIDYKGGGMANLFNGLPHLVGQISNLSGNQVHRAMVSIKSENRRRQRIFNENGVNNINSYTKLFKNGEAKQPVPHLFIIIDEFAELKREEPEFMRELISVAQVGRSLGVHLILATQKPSGTVDDNIWSNSKFRLCLRVQDTQDSKDMLHKPDAAYITQAGRAYLQVGSDEVFELFQSGYSGAAYDANNLNDSKDSVQLINLTGKTELSSLMVKKSRKTISKSVKEVTQLDAVKDYLGKMAIVLGYQKPSQLWMPELKEYIYHEELKDRVRNEFNLEISIGVLDDPENQTQLPLRVDFSRGHIGVIGNVASGKSTMMQTMAYALIKKFTPKELNIYAIDFSSKMMSAFESAPHFGGVMYESDNEKIKKFFNMINSILVERKEKFHGGNYEQYIRVHGLEYPAIVVFIDNYSSFSEKTEGKFNQQITQLVKEGIGHGIYFVVSGMEFSHKDIPRDVADNLSTNLCLALKEKFDYVTFLHTMQIEVLPEQVKGRGIALFENRALEYQTALAIKADNDYQRLEFIKDFSDSLAKQWSGKFARRIPEIPKKPTFTLLKQTEDFITKTKSIYELPIGYDRDNASIYGIPLSRIYCYLISGKSRTGKTNLMKIMIQSTLEKNAQTVVMDNDEKVYSQYSNVDGITYCDSEQSIFDYLSTLLPEFKKRNVFKQELIARNLEDDEIFVEMAKSYPPIFIFISNLDWFVPAIYKSKFKVDGFLKNILTKGRLHNIYFIGELDFTKKNSLLGYEIYEAFVSYKTGIHFGGKVSEQSLLPFEHIPFAQQTKAEKPGIGLLPNVEEGETNAVVIPLAKS